MESSARIEHPWLVPLVVVDRIVDIRGGWRARPSSCGGYWKLLGISLQSCGKLKK
jgi:hypothetical protein